MAIHLTPTELAREAGMERREVIEKCMEMGVPIFQGRIDKTLFLANLSSRPRAPVAGSRRLTAGALARSPPHRIASSAVRGGAMESSSRRQRRPTRERGRSRSPTCVGLAAERYGERPAARYKRDGEWRDVSYTELGETVSEIAPRADRPRHRARRPRRAAVHDARRVDVRGLRDHVRRRASSCPIYPTNSPEECAWVAGNSESRFDRLRGRRAGGEDRRRPRRSCPSSRRSSSIEPRRVERRDRARRAARARPRPRRAPSSRARTAAVKPEDPYTIIYTSGTTGPPKGCVLTPRQLPRGHRACASEIDVIAGGRRRLPLPAARALLRAADPARCASTWARRSPTGAATRSRSSPELMARPSRPTCRRCRGSSRRSTRSSPSNNDPEKIEGGDAARPEGPAQLRGGRPGGARRSSQAHFEKADAELFANVRNIFGGNLRAGDLRRGADRARRSSSSSTPAARPVLEGYGMTETSTVTTTSTVADHRLGTVGRALPGSEIKIADDGEVLVRGPHIFRGYYGNDDTTASARSTRRLAAHRRPRLARRRRLPHDHRPQEGHHDHRGRQEPHAREPRERPQAARAGSPRR